MTNIIIEPGETIEHGSLRYRVTRPVPGGYAYWNVVDTSEPNLPRIAVIWKDTPGAQHYAFDIAEALNLGAKKGPGNDRNKPKETT